MVLYHSEIVFCDSLLSFANGDMEGPPFVEVSLDRLCGGWLAGVLSLSRFRLL